MQGVSDPPQGSEMVDIPIQRETIRLEVASRASAKSDRSTPLTQKVPPRLQEQSETNEYVEMVASGSAIPTCAGWGGRDRVSSVLTPGVDSCLKSEPRFHERETKRPLSLYLDNLHREKPYPDQIFRKQKAIDRIA